MGKAKQDITKEELIRRLDERDTPKAKLFRAEQLSAQRRDRICVYQRRLHEANTRAKAWRIRAEKAERLLHMSLLYFQGACVRWARRCFGTAVISDKRERALRFAEESIELMQAAGLKHYEVLDMLNHVYQRPIGDVRDEIGGTLITVACLASVYGIQMSEAGYETLNKCEVNSDKIRDKHNKKPYRSGGDAIAEPEARHADDGIPPIT